MAKQLLILTVIFFILIFQTCGQRVCIWSDCGATSCSELVGFPHQWASGTCGNSITPCSNGQQRLYCCQERNPYTRVYWVTSCTASCSDCKDNDDCIIPTNACGDQDRCTVGGRALCGATQQQENLIDSLDNGKEDSGFPWYYILLITLGAGGLATIGALSIIIPLFCCNGCNCCNCSPATAGADMNVDLQNVYNY